MTNNVKFVRKELLSTHLDGEIVIFDEDRGKYYALEGVGARIWSILKFPVTVEEISITLCSEYDVSSENCTNEVTRFIKLLNQSNIVTPIRT